MAPRCALVRLDQLAAHADCATAESELAWAWSFSDLAVGSAGSVWDLLASLVAQHLQASDASPCGCWLRGMLGRLYIIGVSPQLGGKEGADFIRDFVIKAIAGRPRLCGEPTVCSKQAQTT